MKLSFDLYKGALELDSAEVQVELDDKRDVKTLTQKKARPIKRFNIKI